MFKQFLRKWKKRGIRAKRYKREEKGSRSGVVLSGTNRAGGFPRVGRCVWVDDYV